MINHPRSVIDEHFRPATPMKVTVRDDISRTGPPGYFRFDGATLYGHNADGAVSATPAGPLPEAPTCASGLTFEPNEIVTALRREQYAVSAASSGRLAPAGLVRKAYYLLRPLFPVAFRKHLQKKYLAGWQSIPFPNWPVDRTVDQLHLKLLALAMAEAGLDELPFIWFWPTGHLGCIAMTHDVETAVGRDQCLRLAELDISRGFRPAFQLIPEVRYEVTDSFLTALRSAGAEINIHGLNHDGHLFDSHNEFERRAAKINRYGQRFEARGFRSPVLYRNPDWFHLLTFDFDMSIPNVGHLDPQRGGCCTVFPYFIGDMIEIPLTTVQDYSLFHVLNDYSIELWRQQIDLILKVHGMACFNIHPDYVTDERARAVFVELLDYLRITVAERNLWSASPGAIADWWKRRSQMCLVPKGGSWAVEGTGSEDAVVAIARRTGARVTLQLPGKAPID